MELESSLKDLVEIAFKVGESQLKEGKSITPQATLVAEDDEGRVIAPIMALMNIFEVKDGIPVLPSLIKGIWAKLLSDRPTLKLEAITFLMDGFLAKREESFAGGEFISPSKNPKSQETLLVQLNLPDKVQTFYWSYVRVGDEVFFGGEPELHPGFNGILPGLWPL